MFKIKYAPILTMLGIMFLYTPVSFAENELHASKKKNKSAAAISEVSGEDLSKSFTQNFLNTLYGKLPGLTVMRGSSDLGNDSPTLYSRGVNTFGDADASLLFIIDGEEAPIDQVTVSEIESIQLLKDAAAAAIYGPRGANGVVVITTKRGVISPLKVQLSAQVGFQNAFKQPKFLGACDYVRLYDEALVNDGLPVRYGESVYNAYQNHTNPYLYPDVNWRSELTKDYSVLQNYNLNFSGGTSVVRYFTMLNVSNNNGLFNKIDSDGEENSNTKYTRYNIRTNVDVNITSTLSAHLTLGASIQDYKGPANGSWDLYNKMAVTPPNAFPVRNPDNTWGGNQAYTNPLGDYTERGYNSYNSRNLMTSLKVTNKFDSLLPGLSASLKFSFNNSFIGNYNKTRKYLYYQIAPNGNDYSYTQYGEKTSFAIDDWGMDQLRNQSYRGSLNYDNTFNNLHDVSAFVEFYVDETFKKKNDDSKISQFPYRHVGMRGMASYCYDSRYMADFSFNYSGSEILPESNRYKFYPALALGWVLSNEEFLSGNSLINYLKLRASYGIVGNEGINSARYLYEHYYVYTAGYNWGINNTSASGMGEGALANNNLTNEKEKRLNVGVELSLLNNLDISFDYFQHKRSDILTSSSNYLPGTLGIPQMMLNNGKATNNGFEASIKYTNNIGKLDYYVNVAGWYALNKIDYMAEEIRTYDYLRRTGQIIGQPFGLVAIGLFKDQAEIDDPNTPVQQFGTVKPGDIRYKDMNKDNVIDNMDVCPIGNVGIPKFTGSVTLGLRYAGFDLETMFYGVAGRSSYLSGPTYWSFQNSYAAPVSALERWTEATKETARYPRLSTVANPNNSQYSSFWQVNGNFLKLRYLELGYTLPASVSNKIFMQKLRVFANGTNLFSLHKMGKYINADPEGLEGTPQMRTISMGVKIDF